MEREEEWEIINSTRGGGREGKREETATKQDKERKEKGWDRRNEGEKETQGKGDKSVERERAGEKRGRWMDGFGGKKLDELEND